MILLDSNIVIYLKNPAYTEHIAQQLSGKRLATSNVVVSEVLGYSKLDSSDAHYFTDLFNTMDNLAFNTDVTNKVIEIRKSKNIQLPDAIIAATAIMNDAVLWTHNLEDFQGIEGLSLFDPLAK